MAENERLAEILRGCKDGSSACFSQLVDMYAGRCYGYFYRLTGSRDISDELLGELFTRLVEKIGSFRGACFEAWLFKIASNIFTDHLRDRQRWERSLEKIKSRPQSEIKEPEPYESEKIDKLQVQLGKLDAETRELIMLRFYSQLSFKEIAEMRGEPIGTTLSKVHRGLKKLRLLME